jgi:hypothetical protein
MPRPASAGCAHNDGFLSDEGHHGRQQGGEEDADQFRSRARLEKRPGQLPVDPAREAVEVAPCRILIEALDADISRHRLHHPAQPETRPRITEQPILQRGREDEVADHDDRLHQVRPTAVEGRRQRQGTDHLPDPPGAGEGHPALAQPAPSPRAGAIDQEQDGRHGKQDVRQSPRVQQGRRHQQHRDECDAPDNEIERHHGISSSVLSWSSLWRAGGTS